MTTHIKARDLWTIAPKLLGLRQYETRLLNSTVWAWSQVPNGNFLTSDRYRKAARRMIDRKFLTRVARTDVWPPPRNPDEWMVVVLTRRNIGAILCAARRSLWGRP